MLRHCTHDRPVWFDPTAYRAACEGYNNSSAYFSLFALARFDPTVKTLLTESQVRAGVETLAQQINTDYARRPLTIIAVMTGSIVLLADLIRLLRMPLRVGVVQASSYRGGTTRGELTVNAEMMPDIERRDVLLIDDIFDTGHTLDNLVRLMRSMGTTSLRTAVLLRKQGRQEVVYQPDYVVFEIPNEFVVGYGLDFQDEFRNLDHIALLEPADLVPQS